MVDMSRGAMSGFLLSNKNTHSFMPGMPAEKDFPIRAESTRQEKKGRTIWAIEFRRAA